MIINDSIGCNVILYLKKGDVMKGKVADISTVETTDIFGRIVKYDTLLLIINGQTTTVRLDKIVAFEVY